MRQITVESLREVAERYDFDGIQLDFARHVPCLSLGRQWELRYHVTDLVRSVRRMLLEVERKRGRPFLLAAKVPQNLKGCRIDGFDVEVWAAENLVDIFTLGSRSMDVDLASFRRITAGRNIKLQPCFDDHHTTDGYRCVPIEVLRGVFANWWQQAAGKKRRGKEPAPVDPTPEEKSQTNFTDAEAKIMKRSNKGFDYCYNAQAVVDGEEQIIMAAEVTAAANDKQQAVPMAQATVDNLAAAAIERPRTIRADRCRSPTRPTTVTSAKRTSAASPRWDSIRTSPWAGKSTTRRRPRRLPSPRLRRMAINLSDAQPTEDLESAEGHGTLETCQHVAVGRS